MPRKAYGGVNNTSKNGIKIYGGVNNLSKKIIAGYVGVNNLSKRFWPPSDALYTIFKDGVFDHVPAGFSMSNVVEVAYNANVKSYLNTNQLIWEHNPEYTRAWSVNNISIDSNFVYNADTPDRNNIWIPSFKDIIDNTKRIKIPSSSNKYYLKVTGFGYFQIVIMQYNPSSSSGYNSISTGSNYIFDTDDVETREIRILSSSSVQYIDRVKIFAGLRTGTYDNVWFESLGVKRWNPTTSSWSSVIDYFIFGYNKFELYINYGSPNKVYAENVSSIDQVYSMTWRNRSGSVRVGGELLSKGPFTAHYIKYDWQGTIVEEATVSAEQIIYNGIPFYRYRYDLTSYQGTSMDNWYPQTVGDNVPGTMFSDDGELEYEFFDSLHIDYSSIQIQEISIIKKD